MDRFLLLTDSGRTSVIDMESRLTIAVLPYQKAVDVAEILNNAQPVDLKMSEEQRTAFRKTQGEFHKKNSPCQIVS